MARTGTMGDAERAMGGGLADGGPRTRRGGSGVDPHKEHGQHGATARDGERADGHNVNGIERALSLAAGGALAAYALKRKDWSALGLGILGGMLVERGVTGHCMVYGALGLSSADADDPVRQHGGAATVDAKKAEKIERAFTIFGRTPQEVYGYWRKLENLPHVFRHLESVTELDGRRSRWVARAPAGRTVEWEAEIVNDVPGEILAWKSLPGSTIPNAGAVKFREAPGGRGTEIKVTLDYEPPAGKVGMAVARLFGEEPAVQVREDLRRYKALLEAGELPVSENPGQGPRARQSFDAQVNRGTTGGDVRRWQQSAASDAHQATHQPPPADAVRGANSTGESR